MISSSSSPSSSSSSSAAVRVEKATSDLLIGPDWTMNMEICDSINANHWLAKDVVKAVKKRLQHKSSMVQLLTLTLLETMVKNCGDYVHFQIVDRNILQDLVKMVKKRADTKVRTKILVLLDSWQEAFGGQGGKYPQYFWTYEELRRSGVQFPRRSPDAVPIFTPPATHPPAKPTQPSSGRPSNGSTSTRLDEAMASEMASLSLPGLDAMGRVAELLTEILRAVNPGDQEAVKDELIVDLVDQCRSNQKRLMQMLTSTGDEELLARGLELNDNLQSVLANHDTVASGLPLPVNNQIADTSMHHQSGDAAATSSQIPEKELDTEPNANSIVPVGLAVSSKGNEVEDDDEDDDDFALLARRHSKPQSSQTAKTENPLSTSIAHESPVAEAIANPNNALVLADPQPPRKITNEQDMIDFLTLALTTTSVESPAPTAHETPVSPTTQVQQTGSQMYHGGVTYNNYVASWAQPQPQPRAHLQEFYQPQPQLQPQIHPQQFPQPQPQMQQFHRQNSFQQQNGVPVATQHHAFQSAQLQYPQQQQYPQTRPSQMPVSQQQQQQQQAFYTQNMHSRAHQQTPFQQAQMPSSPEYPQHSPTYIPPPWAATPGYYSNQRPIFSNNTPHNYSSISYGPTQPNMPQQYNIGSNMQNDPRMSSSPMTTAPAAGQKPFIPSYRLFEDLDVFKQTDGRVKDTSTSGPGQGMIDRNK